VDILEDFAAWANVSARLRGQNAAARIAVLDSLGIAETWERAQARWCATLLDEMAVGDFERVFQYHQACAEHAAKVAAEAAAAKAARASHHDTVPLAAISAEEVRAARVDFRQQLMKRVAKAERATGSRPPSAPDDDGGRFVDKLAPNVIRPSPPQPGQDSTVANVKHVGTVVGAAKELVGWPVGRYAELCAELEHQPQKQKLIWAQHGIVGTHSIRFVVSRWTRRFEQDPTLESEWRNLVDQHLKELRGS